MVSRGDKRSVQRGRTRPGSIVPAAYECAEGGPLSRELSLLRYVDRFGAMAVFGRTPGAGELKSMALAENVVNAYHDRAKAENWAGWARENPELNKLLIMAVKDGE